MGMKCGEARIAGLAIFSVAVNPAVQAQGRARCTSIPGSDPRRASKRSGATATRTMRAKALLNCATYPLTEASSAVANAQMN